MVVTSAGDGIDSDANNSSSDEHVFRFADPFDAGNPDALGKPARYASLSDFDYLPTKLKIVTDGGPGCGGHIWQSAVVLSRYMQILNAKDPSRWQNKTAVELGAGTGIVACALGTLQIPGLKIWSTDLVQLLPLAKQNVALNDLGGIVKVEELAWGKPLPESIPDKPDLLLLADCIYLEITFPWLIETMLLLSTQTTEILLCYKKRRKADKRFFVQLKKHFTWKHVEDDPFKPQYEREGLSLFRLQKRQD